MIKEVKGWCTSREQVRYLNPGEWDALRKAFPELVAEDGHSMKWRGLTLKPTDTLESTTSNTRRLVL
jgi:hypothetical protein